MLTLFTVPKPFRGRVGEIQRNAIESWLALRSDIQVVLVGDEDGVAQAARSTGAEHVGGLARNDRGTPRLDSAFDRVAAVARWPRWCFVNADVLLLDDFAPAVERAASLFPSFLLIGECRELDVAAKTPLSNPAVRAELHRLALHRGRLRGYAALDYFVFPAGLFDPVPPFLIGRACFDNWLVWRVRDKGVPVIDATRSIVAVHQSHDYSHVPGGLEEAYYGTEARHNEQLAGGRERIYTLHDATHRLYPRGRALPYWGSVFRARERARGAKVRIDLRIAARRARKGLQRPVRLIGVLPGPRPETTALLDALAETGDVDLTVLYGKPMSSPGPAQPASHVQWFPRSLSVPLLDRALGRDYPVNWAIWNCFHSLRPDCMMISGCNTFAAQAAIAWCVVRRIPYLLLVDEDGAISRAKRNGGRQLLVDVARRRAAAVLEPGLTATSRDADGVRHDGNGDPAEVWDAATRVLDIAMSAGERRSVRRRPSVARRSHQAAGLLRHPLTRRARRRRTRSVYPGLLGVADNADRPAADGRSPSS